MKLLLPTMIPESIVIVQGENGITTCWVLDQGEGVQAVYDHYKTYYPECPIRVFFCGVQIHDRPVEEVPLEKLTRTPHYMRFEEKLYITEPLDRALMLENPIDINRQYQIENGWQRFMAAKRDGWKTIPCVMRSR